jgi:hypothetical protein
MVEHHANADLLRDAALSSNWKIASSLSAAVWEEHLRNDPQTLSAGAVFCTLFTIAWSLAQNGEYDAAIDTCNELLLGYVETQFHKRGLVIGNPLFHLLVAKIYLANGHAERSICNELIRACSTGGVELLAQEPPRLKELLEKNLRPPSPFASWDESISKQIPKEMWSFYPWPVVEDAFVVQLLESKWGPRK